MSNPSGGGFSPDAAFTGAAERFLEMLKTVGSGPTAAAGGAPNWASLAGTLARQFEHWLQVSQSAGPWFGAAGFGAPGFGAPGFAASPGAAGPPGSGAGFAGAAGWPFGPVPLGPAAARTGEAQRTFELLGRLAQLQGRLAAHWGRVAQGAAQRFVARLGSAPLAPPTPEDALKLYELWVECAEGAYAAAAREEDFCRLQAELANTSAALLVEQRRHAESLVRAFGLPTRNEMDTLYGQLQELRAQFARQPATPRAATDAAGRARAASTRPHARKAPVPGARRRATRKRSPARGPRA